MAWHYTREAKLWAVKIYRIQWPGLTSTRSKARDFFWSLCVYAENHIV